MVVPESTGKDRNRDKKEELPVILLLEPSALGVANGNVTDDEAIHYESPEIKDYFLDRN